MALSAEEIRQILGPIDETIVADVMRTGASRDEVVEAVAWINADEALANAHRKPASGKAAEVIDILEAGLDDDGPDPFRGPPETSE